MNEIFCCQWLFAYSLFFKRQYKRKAFLPMSTSIMSPQMMARTIFIFTLMTGIVYPLMKPNTYWSKRSSNTKLSNFIHNNSQDKYIETEKNNLMENARNEAKRNNLSQKIQSRGILPFLRLSSLLRKIKYIIHVLKMDNF